MTSVMPALQTPRAARQYGGVDISHTDRDVDQLPGKQIQHPGLHRAPVSLPGPPDGRRMALQASPEISHALDLAYPLDNVVYGANFRRGLWVGRAFPSR